MTGLRALRILVALIAPVAAVAAGIGIFYNAGPGPYEHETIRGETVEIFGRGVYRDMSAEVAPRESLKTSLPCSWAFRCCS